MSDALVTTPRTFHYSTRVTRDSPAVSSLTLVNDDAVRETECNGVTALVRML